MSPQHVVGHMVLGVVRTMAERALPQTKYGTIHFEPRFISMHDSNQQMKQPDYTKAKAARSIHNTGKHISHTWSRHPLQRAIHSLPWKTILHSPKDLPIYHFFPLPSLKSPPLLSLSNLSSNSLCALSRSASLASLPSTNVKSSPTVEPSAPPPPCRDEAKR